MREEKRAWGVNSGRQPKQGNDPRPLVRARSPSPPSFFTMLVAALPSLVLAYNANQPLGALREPERAEVGFAEQAAEERAARLNQRFFRTGSPVPHGWRPRPEKLSRAPKKRASVAQITEEQAYPEATITYVTPAMTSQFVRFGMHAQAAALSFRRLSHKQTPPEGSEAWTAARKMPDQAPSDSWAAAEAKAKDEVRWEADAINRDAAEERARQYMAGEDNRRPLGIEKLRVGSKTGLSRCGFSWDDAAVKMGDWCFGTVSTCIAPPGTVDNPESYWFGQNYSCFADLPDIGVRGGGRTCVPKTDAVSAGWCTQFCNTADTFCDPIFCDCTDRGTGLEDMAPFKVPDTFNLSAPVQPPRENLTRTLEQLPPRNHALVAKAIKAAEEQLGGLPDCTWRPGKSCSNTSQYECLQGKHAGECSKSNWFDQPASMCKASCVHTSLLTPAPYYALWYPGPLAKEFHPGEEQPRYHHQPERLSLQARNINLRKSDVMMSDMCKSSDNHFVGISLYSPKYKAKAERLLASCARVGVCCKGTLLPSGAFGPQAPEGSEAYRFETIAMKPSFILSQLEATELPVVFLDTDLEFRKFPQLFVPGSWPNGGRDLAIFNYWGNETDWKHAATPTTGSGVVFVNHTRRGRAVLTAWAEAMAYPGNERAPDDQARRAAAVLRTHLPPEVARLIPPAPYLPRCLTSCSTRAAGSRAPPSAGSPPRTCALCPLTIAALIQ